MALEIHKCRNATIDSCYSFLFFLLFFFWGGGGQFEFQLFNHLS